MMNALLEGYKRMKLKEKLIHWLGGYTYQTHQTVNIVHCPTHMVTLKAESHFSPYEREEAMKEYIKKDLAYKLGEKMLDENMITFSEKVDAISAMIRIVVSD